MPVPSRLRLSFRSGLALTAVCALAIALAGADCDTIVLSGAQITVSGMVADSRSGKAIDGAQVTFTDVSLMGGTDANRAHIDGPPWGASRPGGPGESKYYSRALGKSNDGRIAAEDSFKWCTHVGALELNARRLGVKRKAPGEFTISVSKEGFVSESRTFYLWKLPKSNGTYIVDLGNINLTPSSETDRDS